MRNNAGDDPTAPSLTPSCRHAIARPAEIELLTIPRPTSRTRQTDDSQDRSRLKTNTALTATGALAAGSTVVNGAVTTS
ncbi:MAG: hypothetical protein ACLUEQ_04255 [Cloacibacillus evryensis]